MTVGRRGRGGYDLSQTRIYVWGCFFVMAVRPGDGDTKVAPIPTAHTCRFPSTTRYSVVVKSTGISRIQKVTAGEAMIFHGLSPTGNEEIESFSESIIILSPCYNSVRARTFPYLLRKESCMHSALLSTAPVQQYSVTTR